MKIGVVGKYTDLIESYKSLDEALRHGAIANQVKLEMVYIDAEDLESGKMDDLKAVDAILVPGGFGERGTEGKITAIKFARENHVPFFGICLGMQLIMEKSYEFGEHEGLGYIRGDCKRFPKNVNKKKLLIPHISWNKISFNDYNNTIFKGVKNLSFM